MKLILSGLLACLLSTLASAEVIDQKALTHSLVTAFLAQTDQSDDALDRLLTAEGVLGSRIGHEVKQLVLHARALSAAGLTLSTSSGQSFVKQADTMPFANVSASRRRALLGLNGYRPETAEIKSNQLMAKTDADGAAEPVQNNGVVTPSIDEQDIRLRNAGISFSNGIGVAQSGSDDAAMLTAVARWNLIQKTASAKWNSMLPKISAGETTEAGGYGIVPYFGDYYYWAPDGTFSTNYKTWEPNRFWPDLTAFGPFIGTALAGEKLTMGTKEVRPYFAGLSAGFGFLDQAASMLYVDVGVTISPHDGFKHSDLFYGISLDGTVLAKIMGLRNKPNTDTGTK